MTDWETCGRLLQADVVGEVVMSELERRDCSTVSESDPKAQCGKRERERAIVQGVERVFFRLTN